MISHKKNILPDAADTAAHSCSPSEKTSVSPILFMRRKVRIPTYVLFNSTTSSSLQGTVSAFFAGKTPAYIMHKEIGGLTLYFFFNSTISGSRQISPSMLYIPSTMMIIFFHGRCVRGWPSTMLSRSTCSKCDGTVLTEQQGTTFRGERRYLGLLREETSVRAISIRSMISTHAMRERSGLRSQSF